MYFEKRHCREDKWSGRLKRSTYLIIICCRNQKKSDRKLFSSPVCMYVLVLLESTSSHGGFHWLSESEIQVDLFPFCFILMSFMFGLLILVWPCLMIIWSCSTEEEDASSADHGCALIGSLACQSASLHRSWSVVYLPEADNLVCW